MADVELESAQLARQFRSAVDDLHGELLRLGTDPAENGIALIRDRRLRLSRWVADRTNAAPQRTGATGAAGTRCGVGRLLPQAGQPDEDATAAGRAVG